MKDHLAFFTVVDVSESYIIVGNPRAHNNTGELYVYHIDGFYLRTIRAYDGDEDDLFAWSLSLHNELIVVGAPGGGKAYVYHVSGDLSAELTPADSMDGDRFGWSVGISDAHIVIGAPGNRLGKAYIYTTMLNPVGIPIEIVPNDLDENGRFAYALMMSWSLKEEMEIGPNAPCHFAEQWKDHIIIIIILNIGGI